MWRADSSVRHQRADSILTICLIRTSLASLQPSGGIAILTGWPRAVSLAAAFFASSIPGCVPSGLGLSLSATIITGAPSGSGTLPRFEVPNATHTGWCVDCQRENPSSAPSQIRMSPLPGRHSAAPVKIPLIRRYFLPSSLSRGLPRNWTRANLPALPGRRLLYHSATVRTFLATNNANRRRPCPPGMFYCFRCRERRKPALGLVDYADRPAGAGNLTAIYESCGTIMNRRARREALPTIIPGLDVNIRHAPATLAGNHSPSDNCGVKERGSA
jgi:hypothetical protein